MSSATHSGLIIQNSAKEYLLQMRDGNTKWAPLDWAFFGGAIDEGEDPIETAVREASEELALTVAREDLTEFAHFDYEPDGTGIFFYQYGRYVEWGDFRVGEGAGAAFFSLAELSRLTLPPFTQLILDNYLT